MEMPNLAQTSLYTGIAGAFSSMIGGYFGAQTQKISLDLQSDISAINARIAELSAQSALDAGKVEAAQTTLKYGAVKSSQRAALAANGVDLGVGNAVEIQASTDLMKEIDRNTIKSNAIRAAIGYRTQSASYQADSMMKSASASGISPLSAGFGNLLEGATRVSSNWYQLKKSGALDTPSNSLPPLGDAPMSGTWGL